MDAKILMLNSLRLLSVNYRLDSQVRPLLVVDRFHCMMTLTNSALTIMAELACMYMAGLRHRLRDQSGISTDRPHAPSEGILREIDLGRSV